MAKGWHQVGTGDQVRILRGEPAIDRSRWNRCVRGKKKGRHLFFPTKSKARTLQQKDKNGKRVLKGGEDQPSSRGGLARKVSGAITKRDRCPYILKEKEGEFMQILLDQGQSGIEGLQPRWHWGGDHVGKRGARSSRAFVHVLLKSL